MAGTKRKSKQRRGRPVSASSRRGRTAAAPVDAIALLKADHRQVEGWFEQFQSTRSERRKRDLAQKICAALRVHTTIEEEIFYPAFLEATSDTEMHHEAEIEHDGAKKLIAAIEASGPDDDYYGARVKVLAEMIKHHVNEEEQRGGMFAEARRSAMDLKAIGARLAARRRELMSDAGAGRAAGKTSRKERSGVMASQFNA